MVTHSDRFAPRNPEPQLGRDQVLLVLVDGELMTVIFALSAGRDATVGAFSRAVRHDSVRRISEKSTMRRLEPTYMEAAGGRR